MRSPSQEGLNMKRAANKGKKCIRRKRVNGKLRCAAFGSKQGKKK